MRGVPASQNDAARALAARHGQTAATPRVGSVRGADVALVKVAARPWPDQPVLRARPHKVRMLSFGYRAWNGATCYALVVVPAWYRKAGRPPLPLVISSHGRGGPAQAPVRRWRDLEARDGFILVAPSGQGRRIATYSFAAAGQLSDLMRMPQLVHRAFPSIRSGGAGLRSRVEHGAMEALMLAARYPDRIAACLSSMPSPIWQRATH